MGRIDFHSPDSLVKLSAGCVLFVISLGGNVLIIEAIRRNRTLRTTTNILLASVAFADVICTVFLPLLTIQVINLPKGLGSDLLCKIFIDYHVPVTASTISIITLAVVAVERYHAIIKPMRLAFRLREDNVYQAIVVVWIVSIVITLPLYTYGRYNVGDHKCKNGFPYGHFPIYLVFFIVLVLLLPIVTNLFCYFEILRELYFKKNVAPQNGAIAEDDKRSKKKLVRVALTITAANAICLVPVVVLGILYFFNIVSKHLFNHSAALYFTESAINPFLYAFQSSNFRKAFKAILRGKKCF